MVKKFTIKDFLKINVSYKPSFSPDGSQMLYLNNDSGTAQIYLLDLKSGKSRQLTKLKDYIAHASFSPTENKIIYGVAEAGNENTQLFLIDSKTKKVTNLTKNLKARFNIGGWSNDGQQIAFTSNERNNIDFDVYTLNLRTKKKKLVWKNKGWWSSYGFSPFGNYLVINLSHSLVNDEIHLLNLTTRKAKQITELKKEAIYGWAEWLPNESGFFLRTNVDKEFIGVSFYSLKENTFKRIYSPKWDVEETNITKDGKYLSVITNEDGYNKLEILKTKNFRPISHIKFPNGYVTETNWNKEGTKLAFSFTSPTERWNVWVFDKTNNKVEKVTTSKIKVPETLFIEPKLIHYKSFDGLKISAFLYLPKTKSKKKIPAIVNIHGGPEGQYQPVFGSVTQYLVYSGYAVIFPNVRGSTGYGKKFVDLDNIRKRMDSVKDLEYLHKYLKSNNKIDPKKVALMGGSYGGFMVLAGLYKYPNLWAAGVDIVGISNFVTFLKNTAEYRRYLRESEYGSLKNDRKLLESISPINHVKNIKAPLFIVHGANDPRVPLIEAEQMYRKLRTLKRNPTLLIYKDEGHGLGKLKNILDAYPKIVNFLDKYLK